MLISLCCSLFSLCCSLFSLCCGLSLLCCANFVVAYLCCVVLISFCCSFFSLCCANFVVVACFHCAVLISLCCGLSLLCCGDFFVLCTVEDSYVDFYIQLRNTCTAYETLLSLQLLERGENGEQAEGRNMLIQDSLSVSTGGAWEVWRHTAQKIKMFW